MDKMNTIKKCDICLSYATVLCYECLNYFCDTCYKYVHDKENNANHKKEKMDDFVPTEIKCSKHLKNPLSLFCVEEKGK